MRRSDNLASLLTLRRTVTPSVPCSPRSRVITNFAISSTMRFDSPVHRGHQAESLIVLITAERAGRRTLTGHITLGAI